MGVGVYETAHFYGTFVGKKLNVSDSGRFHVDTGNSGTVVTMGGGIDVNQLSRPVRWIEPF